MMLRAATTLTIGILTALSLSAHAAGAGEELNPQPGQWSTVIAVYDHLDNHYLLKTSVHNDLNTCMAQLANQAREIEAANGIVWTAPQHTALKFEKEPGVENEAKVLEMRCVLEPFQPERI